MNFTKIFSFCDLSKTDFCFLYMFDWVMGTRERRESRDNWLVVCRKLQSSSNSINKTHDLILMFLFQCSGKAFCGGVWRSETIYRRSSQKSSEFPIIHGTGSTNQPSPKGWEPRARWIGGTSFGGRPVGHAVSDARVSLWVGERRHFLETRFWEKLLWITLKNDYN